MLRLPFAMFTGVLLDTPVGKLDRWEGSQKHNSYNILKMYILNIWPSSGFMSIKISLYKFRELRYDVEISHRNIVELYRRILCYIDR